MSKAVQIRRAGGADAPALNAIVHGSASHKGDYAPMLDGYTITAEQITRDEIYLAEDRGPSGPHTGADAGLKARGPVLGFYSLVLGDTPELDLLFVDDAAQGRGIGRLLMQHMIALAVRHGVASVKIISHPPAADFYRGLGAIDVGYAYPMGRVSWVRPIFMLSTSTKDGQLTLSD